MDAVLTASLVIQSPELGSKSVYSVRDPSVDAFVDIDDFDFEEDDPTAAPFLDFVARGYCRSPFEKRIVIIRGQNPNCKDR